ncbi:NRAMP family metal ion transporter [Acidihalobacter yilgarnensis]|uniref:NRAMP family metal ion transporter n=1 Tax=Acidihalobacter yilgarnensis TaxID=2819280 RepID=A0A1D8ING5_9GAMM|nr:divalent metal cation transporter [Acidihalobacter yilgarnensis]AOU98018.1 NRAMP family metal ion transporter [Acidihalobacter yilgarnensis]
MNRSAEASPIVVPDQRHAIGRWRLAMMVFGPGLVVMLADTDVGSIITAAQSGAQWGYHLLPLQLVLIPILYVVQELTVRLGLITGKGHGELIRETFGRGWAWLSVSTLVIACVGALLTEFSGVASVGRLYGVPIGVSLGLAAGFLILVVWTGSYRRVERVAMLMGAFELAFFWVAARAHPNVSEALAGFSHIPMGNPGYLYLVAANIGAVIMPWMVFYQQSAIADKGLQPQALRYARFDTAIGAVVTQLVMAAVLIAAAATLGTHSGGPPLDTVEEIADAMTPYLGAGGGRLIFSIGILGAGMVAAIVVSLAAAWGLGEVAGYRRSLQDSPQRAPWFYAVYSFVVIAGAVVVGVAKDLVALSIAVEVMNALLLPLVLGFLFLLGRRSLPPAHRLRGIYAWLVAGTIIATSCLGLYGGLSWIFGGS